MVTLFKFWCDRIQMIIFMKVSFYYFQFLQKNITLKKIQFKVFRFDLNLVWHNNKKCQIKTVESKVRRVWRFGISLFCFQISNLRIQGRVSDGPEKTSTFDCCYYYYRPFCDFWTLQFKKFSKDQQMMRIDGIVIILSINKIPSKIQVQVEKWE